MTISHHNFNEIASSSVQPKKKRQAPFSLRLSFEEKAALKKMAGNEPLGAYIKAVLFDEARTGVRRSNCPKHDGKAVGRALAVASGCLRSVSIKTSDKSETTSDQRAR